MPRPIPKTAPRKRHSRLCGERDEGDVVFVKKGRWASGIGTGDYVFDPEGGQLPELSGGSLDVRIGNWPTDERLAMKTLTETDYL